MKFLHQERRGFATTALFTITLLLTISACRQQTQQKAAPPSALALDSFVQLEADWLVLLKKQNPSLSMLSGEPLESLPDISYQGSVSRAAQAEVFLARLEKIDPNPLPHQHQLTYAIIHQQLMQIQDQPTFFYLSFDCTPYQLGFMVSSLIPQFLGGVNLEKPGQGPIYLQRLKELTAFIVHLENKIETQTARGILLPIPALPGVRAIIESLIPRIEGLSKQHLAVSNSWPEPTHQTFVDDVTQVLNQELKPAVAKLRNQYDSQYEAKAGQAVGLGQYPGGKDYYRALVKHHATLDITPEAIHQQGLALQANLHREMATIRQDLGFTGTSQEFHLKLKEDPRFYLKSPEAVANMFDRYIKRIEPKLAAYFTTLPKAPYGVLRLDPANEAGMTFGFYQVPAGDEARGLYRFNGSNLDQRPMIWAGPLIYHELVPGHHFHLALQNENLDLSDFRKQGVAATAFVEGWANYAAFLAVEMGMLPEPLERYGWLLFDSFITARLVLDTGMNFYGWSLEKAKSYMLENTFQSEEEVMSELLRYSTDMPGQALAYKLGFEHFKNLRAEMTAKHGKAFNLKVFHTAALESGTLPLNLVSKHVDWFFTAMEP